MRYSTLLALPLAAALACADRNDAADTSAASGTTSAALPAPTAGATTQATGDVQPTGGMIDPNTASAQQLASAGLDSAAAAALVAGRPYADMVGVDRALAARNLSAEQRKTVYATVWKPIALNSASDEEILLIPGIGRRMLHEFKEYRPYTSIEQFRREIGKYVNNEEVARLEKYVSVR
jgi:DNA uptake protein ComE-like DNA-binding protein